MRTLGSAIARGSSKKPRSRKRGVDERKRRKARLQARRQARRQLVEQLERRDHPGSFLLATPILPLGDRADDDDPLTRQLPRSSSTDGTERPLGARPGTPRSPHQRQAHQHEPHQRQPRRTPVLARPSSDGSFSGFERIDHRPQSLEGVSSALDFDALQSDPVPSIFDAISTNRVGVFSGPAGASGGQAEVGNGFVSLPGLGATGAGGAAGDAGPRRSPAGQPSGFQGSVSTPAPLTDPTGGRGAGGGEDSPTAEMVVDETSGAATRGAVGSSPTESIAPDAGPFAVADHVVADLAVPDAAVSLLSDAPVAATISLEAFRLNDAQLFVTGNVEIPSGSYASFNVAFFRGEDDSSLGITNMRRFATESTFNIILPDPTGASSIWAQLTATDAGQVARTAVQEVIAGPDSDGDGISDAIERRFASGGDANGDGIPDWQQNTVAIVPDARSGQFVTLESDRYPLANVRPCRSCKILLNRAGCRSVCSPLT